MSVIVEIRAAEGGADAKMLVEDQFALYVRLAARLNFNIVELARRSGYRAFRAQGVGSDSAFDREPGGHRWQRVPPSEKRGRVHTSTVTVAVLPEPTKAEIGLPANELHWATCRGSGAGGQHRNVTDSAVILTHKTTGLQVRCESERSQKRNKEHALLLLRAKLWRARQEALDASRSATRRGQVGSGMRGDKVFTYSVPRDSVKHHQSGQKWKLSRYLIGLR